MTVCPCCGYCEKCGRSNQPVQPRYVPYIPYPYNPWYPNLAPQYWPYTVTYTESSEPNGFVYTGYAGNNGLC